MIVGQKVQVPQKTENPQKLVIEGTTMKGIANAVYNVESHRQSHT